MVSSWEIAGPARAACALSRRPGGGVLAKCGAALRVRARGVIAPPRPLDSDIVALMSTGRTETCLQSGEYVDSGAPEIVAFPRPACGGAGDAFTKGVGV